MSVFTRSVCCFGKYFSVLKLLFWFAELFALTGGYKPCVLQDCWNSDSSLKVTSQISLSNWEMLFGFSLGREISEPLWLTWNWGLCLHAAELYNLQLLLKRGEKNLFILTAKQAFLPFETSVISSPPGMCFPIPSCPIPRVSSSVS